MFSIPRNILGLSELCAAMFLPGRLLPLFSPFVFLQPEHPASFWADCCPVLSVIPVRKFLSTGNQRGTVGSTRWAILEEPFRSAVPGTMCSSLKLPLWTTSKFLRS